MPCLARLFGIEGNAYMAKRRAALILIGLGFSQLLSGLGYAVFLNKIRASYNSPNTRGTGRDSY
jgi:hypothetical protein